MASDTIAVGQFQVLPITKYSTLKGRFYRLETQGRYLDKPVSMVVSRETDNCPETISISWITFFLKSPLVVFFLVIIRQLKRNTDIRHHTKRVFCKLQFNFCYVIFNTYRSSVFNTYQMRLHVCYDV